MAARGPVILRASRRSRVVSAEISFRGCVCRQLQGCFTVYSNTLATQYPEKPSEIRKLLQRHIVEPVQFEQQIRQMRADGVEVFVEVGPGAVLTGLIKRILPDAKLLNVNDPKSLDVTVQALRAA